MTDKAVLAAGEMPDEIKALAAPFVKKIGRDVIVYKGDIQHGTDEALVSAVRRTKSSKSVTLLLCTNGGSADSAFRIARCLQENYDSFNLFVHSYCKSAGTLVALAANELVMSDAAELGPLDVQLSKPDELMEWTSGLIPIQALNTLRQQSFESFEHYFLNMRYRSGLQITTRTAFEISAKLVVGLFGPIFEQLDPLRLGEIQRAMSIAHDYGTRLAGVGNNAREDTLKMLIAGYPSHGFIIDRREAAELFQRVREPTEDESNLALLMASTLSEWDEDEAAFVGCFSPTFVVKSTDDSKPEDRANAKSKAPKGGGRTPSPRRRDHGTSGNGQPQPVRQGRRKKKRGR